MRRFRDEAQLLKGLRGSDPLSFKAIYKLHWRKLYNIAFHTLEDHADAEDIVQDVFYSLWLRREQLQISTSLERYLVRAVKYTAWHYLKKQTIIRDTAKMEANPQEAVNNVEEQLFQKDVESMVKSLLDTLPLKTRRIFSLSRFHGLTYPEIASEMGISVKAVEYHVSKVLRQLSVRKGSF